MTEATEVGPISVNSSEDEHIFVPGTVVNMTCTGTVGNPPGNLHWCYKRYGLDVDFIEYPSEMDITWENVTQIGCQFSQLSVLSYTLSNEWSNIIFLCELRMLIYVTGTVYHSTAHLFLGAVHVSHLF
jgi:hypothetical protein